ncbi:MAG: porin family protein [Muribaculaceae bacterium]|nr:porin family protein [Muribaculaceae bacterium]MBR6490158.1 porin family protein [Muribaculaceae bacterium]
MKKFLAFVVVAIMGVSAASAQKGAMAVGGNLLYGSEINSIGIGAKFQYGILENLRGEASFNYYFQNKGFRMWDLNANAHYLFDIAPKFRAYPLAGLTVVNKSYSDVDDSVTRFGLNLGGGCEYDVAPNVVLNAEFKYSIVSTIDQAVFGIGAVYKF